MTTTSKLRYVTGYINSKHSDCYVDGDEDSSSAEQLSPFSQLSKQGDSQSSSSEDGTSPYESSDESSGSDDDSGLYDTMNGCEPYQEQVISERHEYNTYDGQRFVTIITETAERVPVVPDTLVYSTDLSLIFQENKRAWDEIEDQPNKRKAVLAHQDLEDKDLAHFKIREDFEPNEPFRCVQTMLRFEDFIRIWHWKSEAEMAKEYATYVKRMNQVHEHCHKSCSLNGDVQYRPCGKPTHTELEMIRLSLEGYYSMAETRAGCIAAKNKRTLEKSAQK